MIKLKIEKIDGYNYYLRDKNGKSYKLNIEFYDLIEKPIVNDEFYIHENLLRKNYTMLNFGQLSGKYGKRIECSDDADLLILIMNHEKKYLKRYYG